MDRVLNTAQAVVEGGRAGHGRTDDGRLDVAVSVPRELGGGGGPGTNPEQLFAVGYAACFESALLGVARGRNMVASEARITSRVGLGSTGHGGFSLTGRPPITFRDFARRNAHAWTSRRPSDHAHRRVEGRRAVAELYRGYSSNIVLRSADELAVH